MLKTAYLETSDEVLNKLISKGKYKYLNFSNYRVFQHIELEDTEWSKISKISVDSKGNILGYFSIGVDNSQRRLHSAYFVKFRYKFKDYSSNEDLEEIVNEDFQEFVDLIFNHPYCNRVEFMAVAKNPANKTYMKWVNKYKGSVNKLSNYVMLEDGKYYDVNMYWFDNIGKIIKEGNNESNNNGRCYDVRQVYLGKE